MTTRKIRLRTGFTVLELMVVVAIIGLLASIAIPSFINYQLTSKRSEAFANLSSVAKTQKAYFAEFNRFVPVAAEPGNTLGNVPNAIKRSSAPIGPAFSLIGWIPEGDVFYDYDTNTTAGCTCIGPCFTSAAYGDLDGNGQIGILVFAEPDAAGNFCPSGVLGRSPINDSLGNPQLATVVAAVNSDRF